MIEAYSQNIAVNANSFIPFENVKIDKGCFENIRNASILFNRCGVYRITVSGTIEATEAGDVVLELVKDGAAQLDTTTQATVAATGFYPVSFTTFLQVNKNNSDCCCSSPTTIGIRNSGIATSFANIKIDVDKIC